MLVTVNNRLKFEIEIVHDLSCHPILLLFLPWYFISRGLKLANVKMYQCVQNGYDGGSETANVLARHATLNAELPWKYTGVIIIVICIIIAVRSHVFLMDTCQLYLGLVLSALTGR